MSYRKRAILLALTLACVGLLIAPVSASALPAYSTQWGGFTNPTHIAADGYGNVYVADWGASTISKFNGTGTLITSWPVAGGTEGIAINRTQQALVANWSNDVVTIRNSGNGALLYTVGTGTSGSGNGQFNSPEGVAFDRYGFIYVTDAGNNRVQKFSSTGVYKTQWGTLGTGAGQLSSPYGIAVDSLGYVYVADYDNDRVQKFTSTGAYVSQWGTSGTGNGQFSSPAGIDIGQDGLVYVTDANNNRVQIFTTAGVFVSKFGSAGSSNGQFASPWGITSDGTGVYVVDRNNDRVEKFTLNSAKQTKRIGGYDRYEVAVNLAKSRWGSNLKGAKSILVTCGEDRANADPLAASGLAGILDAPIFLTQSSTLNSRTKAALQLSRATNGPLRVWVVGGTGSVPTAVLNAIKAVNPGGTVSRVNGADRYDLSVALATQMKAYCDSKGVPIPAVMLFNGQNSAAFYDALAASPLSAGGQVPMMAVRNTSVPLSVQNALSGPFAGKTRIVVNSTTYIPESLRIAAGATGRLSNSADRYQSARMIATWGRLLGYVGLKNIGLANKLPDALTGGTYIGEQGGILLYTGATTIPTTTKDMITICKIGSQQGSIFGGTGSVSDAALASFNTVLNTP